MTPKLQWTTRASKQLADAAVRLEEARTGFGTIFLDDVEQLVSTISSAPRRYPRVLETSGEVRRALVFRFGYWLIFDVEENQVDVLAVWHGRQDPEGWR